MCGNDTLYLFGLHKVQVTGHCEVVKFFGNKVLSQKCACLHICLCLFIGTVGFYYTPFLYQNWHSNC